LSNPLTVAPEDITPFQSPHSSRALKLKRTTSSPELSFGKTQKSLSWCTPESVDIDNVKTYYAKKCTDLIIKLKEETGKSEVLDAKCQGLVELLSYMQETSNELMVDTMRRTREFFSLVPL